MNKINRSILAVALGLGSLTAFGQENAAPTQKNPPPPPAPRNDASAPNPGPNAEGPNQGPGPEGRLHHPRSIFAALDTNHDGVLEADEIANASKVLQELAKTHGGQLTREQFGPPGRLRRELDRRPPPLSFYRGEGWGPEGYGPPPRRGEFGPEGRPYPRGPVGEGYDEDRGPGRFGPPPPRRGDFGPEGSSFNRPPLRDGYEGNRGPEGFRPQPPRGGDFGPEGRSFQRPPFRDGYEGNRGPEGFRPQPPLRGQGDGYRPGGPGPDGAGAPPRRDGGPNRGPRPQASGDDQRPGQPPQGGVRPPRPGDDNASNENDAPGRPPGPAPQAPRE